MLERATRLCAMSPMMATRRPSSVGRRSRMVRASSSAWVGCSCVPSPALMMGVGKIARQKVRRAGSRVAHHDGVGVHGAERIQRVDQRFAFGNAGGGGGDGDGVGAQTLGGDFETGARARGGFEEQIDDHAAAQLIGFLGVGLAGLKTLGPVEDAFDLDSIQRLDSQQSTGHLF